MKSLASFREVDLLMKLITRSRRMRIRRVASDSKRDFSVSDAPEATIGSWKIGDLTEAAFGIAARLIARLYEQERGARTTRTPAALVYTFLFVDQLSRNGATAAALSNLVAAYLGSGHRYNVACETRVSRWRHLFSPTRATYPMHSIFQPLLRPPVPRTFQRFSLVQVDSGVASRRGDTGYTMHVT